MKGIIKAITLGLALSSQAANFSQYSFAKVLESRSFLSSKKKSFKFAFSSVSFSRNNARLDKNNSMISFGPHASYSVKGVSLQFGIHSSVNSYEAKVPSLSAKNHYSISSYSKSFKMFGAMPFTSLGFSHKRLNISAMFGVNIFNHPSMQSYNSNISSLMSQCPMAHKLKGKNMNAKSPGIIKKFFFNLGGNFKV